MLVAQNHACIQYRPHPRHRKENLNITQKKKKGKTLLSCRTDYYHEENSTMIIFL